MKKIIGLILCLSGAAHAAPLKVVTTTSDLADIAQIIGGETVFVESLARPNQNPHFVDAKPSLIVKLTKADIFIQTGLDLELGWAPVLLISSRNKKIQPGMTGFLDASEAITPIEITPNPSRAMGDVHPHGNPHYMANPDNGLKVAQLITKKLIQLRPDSKTSYEKNLASFETALSQKIKEWDKALQPLKGLKFASYHKDWNYFAERFGFESVGTLEPKPGIPPTAQHTANIMALIKAENVRVIFTDPWYEKKTGEFISKSTNAKILELVLFPGGNTETKSYIDAIDFNVRSVLSAVK